MTSGAPHLTVLIPARDEAARIGATLDRVRAWADEAGIDAEIVVVDDGSSDGTADVARGALRRSGRVVVLPENRGKGYAVRRGIEEARGRWVLMTDADLSAPIEEHARLAEAAREGDLDLAIGSRAVPGARVEVRQGALRRLAGRVFNAAVRLATGLGARDTQCGFKLLDRARLLPIVRTMRIDGFAFDVELLFLCDRFGLRVAEVPVVWRDDRASNVRLLTDPFRMLWDVARIRWNFRRGRYRPRADDTGDRDPDRDRDPAEPVRS